MRKTVSLPLMVTGGFRSRVGMNEALESGSVSLVGLARPLAVDPELPRRLLQGEVDVTQDHAVRVGVRTLDDLLQVHWYQRQLACMGEGRGPDPRLGRWSTALGALVSMYWELLTCFMRSRHSKGAGR